MTRQFLRKATLIVSKGTKALDLSEMHFTFETKQQDVESPNNLSVRVYNLAPNTVKTVREEFDTVTLQAGYGDAYGVIFQGNIKQYRIGRENAVNSYLDILSADGDLAYNYAVVNKTLAAGSTPGQRVQAVVSEMAPKGVTLGYQMQYTGGILPRGKVLFGMARALLRQEVANQGATWNINNGQVEILPLTGYRPGEAVVLNAQTGLVGIPEQTQEGLKVRSLLNPRLSIGGLIKIDNATINQLVQQNPNAAPIAFNQYTGIQNFATIASDGLYRLFVVEHRGNTRGPEWYSDLICLAVNPVTKEVKPYG